MMRGQLLPAVTGSHAGRGHVLLLYAHEKESCFGSAVCIFTIPSLSCKLENATECWVSVDFDLQSFISDWQCLELANEEGIWC